MSVQTVETTQYALKEMINKRFEFKVGLPQATLSDGEKKRNFSDICKKRLIFA